MSTKPQSLVSYTSSGVKSFVSGTTGAIKHIANSTKNGLMEIFSKRTRGKLVSQKSLTTAALAGLLLATGPAGAIAGAGLIATGRAIGAGISTGKGSEGFDKLIGTPKYIIQGAGNILQSGAKIVTAPVSTAGAIIANTPLPASRHSNFSTPPSVTTDAGDNTPNTPAQPASNPTPNTNTPSNQPASGQQSTPRSTTNATLQPNTQPTPAPANATPQSPQANKAPTPTNTANTASTINTTTPPNATANAEGQEAEKIKKIEGIMDDIQKSIKAAKTKLSKTKAIDEITEKTEKVTQAKDNIDNKKTTYLNTKTTTNRNTAIGSLTPAALKLALADTTNPKYVYLKTFINNIGLNAVCESFTDNKEIKNSLERRDKRGYNKPTSVGVKNSLEELSEHMQSNNPITDPDMVKEVISLFGTSDTDEGYYGTLLSKISKSLKSKKAEIPRVRDAERQLADTGAVLDELSKTVATSKKTIVSGGGRFSKTKLDESAIKKSVKDIEKDMQTIMTTASDGSIDLSDNLKEYMQAIKTNMTSLAA